MTDATRVTEGTGDGSDAGEDAGTVPVWLVERTFSDDEQNIVILVYATEDGRRYLRKERALTSFTGPARTTYAGLAVDVGDTAPVDDPEERERYATEARRMADEYDVDDPL